MADLPFVIVRREPDDGMIEAGDGAMADGAEWGRMAVPSEVFRAMISASPPPVSLEEMVEALEAFASLCDDDDADLPDNTPVVVKFGPTTDYTLRLGDLRRARSLLSRLKDTEAQS